MPRTLEHMTGMLYRVGLHHEDGVSSMVSLSARPVRLVAGEVAASAADVVAAVAKRPGVKARANRGGLQTPGDIGPSTT